METLTKEDLSFLQESIKKLNSAKSLLADLEIKKHETLLMIGHHKGKVQSKEKELINKYGLDSVINIETGQVKKKEK
tara:strand:- start:15754 stop:15984 length:231 start_codon:yes stop_codon:yes gene_type:complete